MFEVQATLASIEIPCLQAKTPNTKHTPSPPHRLLWPSARTKKAAGHKAAGQFFIGHIRM